MDGKGLAVLVSMAGQGVAEEGPEMAHPLLVWVSPRGWLEGEGLTALHGPGSSVCA